MKANRAVGEQDAVIVRGWLLISLLSCLHAHISDKSSCPEIVAGRHVTCGEEEAEEETLNIVL